MVEVIVKLKLFLNIYVSLLLCFSVTGVCTAQFSFMKGDFIKCASYQSVSGYESEFHNYIKSRIPQGIITETDNFGNLIARIGEGKPEIIILCTIDEPGYVVSAINEEGYLRVQMVSNPAHSLFHQFYEGHFVDIMTDNGMINGVVSIPSSHITRNKTEIKSLEDFFIDIGVRSKDEAATGVNILDRVTAVKDFAELAGNRFSGPSLSYKFPVFAMLETITSVRNAKNCMFVWATQGLRRNSGVTRIASKFEPEKVILAKAFLPAYDRRSRSRTSTIDVPGSGVLVPKSDSQFSNDLYNSIVHSAERQQINLTESDIGSLNETGAFRNMETQIVPIGIPVKYPFSLVEVIDFDDLEQLIKLLKTVVSK